MRHVFGLNRLSAFGLDNPLNKELKGAGSARFGFAISCARGANSRLLIHFIDTICIFSVQTPKRDNYDEIVFSEEECDGGDVQETVNGWGMCGCV